MTSRQAIRGAMQQGERVARATGRVGALGVHAGGTHAGRGVVMALLRLVSRRHAELATASCRQITNASSSNATATRRVSGASTASSLGPPRTVRTQPWAALP